MEISKEFTFEASHVLPRHPGKCSRLHGHSWKLLVVVSGEVDEATGFVMDYATLKEFVEPLIESLDHRHLGQWVDKENQSRIPTDPAFFIGNTSHCLPGTNSDFYPSSENLIVWIAEYMSALGYAKHNIAPGKFPWSRLELNETCTSRCVLTREEYDKVTRNR